MPLIQPLATQQRRVNKNKHVSFIKFPFYNKKLNVFTAVNVHMKFVHNIIGCKFSMVPACGKKNKYLDTQTVANFIKSCTP